MLRCIPSGCHGLCGGSGDGRIQPTVLGVHNGKSRSFFRERLPNGGRVFLCDTFPGTVSMLQRDGLLPRNITPAYDIASADFALVHHEDHFVEVDYQIWVTWDRVDPVHVLTYDGVPIISVYENPRRVARESPRPTPVRSRPAQ